MNIVLINDTYNFYHWGCHGTSKAISEFLTKENIVEYVSILDVYDFKNAPINLNTFDDEIHLYNYVKQENLEIFQKITNSELVIINGEGTIHGVPRHVVNLLYIAYFSKRFLKKRVHIINHSSYPITRPDDSKKNIFINEAARALYKKVYSIVDYVGIREPESKDSLQKIGINSTLTFDCLPLAIEKYLEKNQLNKKEKKIILAGGVNFNKIITNQLIEILKKLSSEYKIVILTGSKNNPALDDIKFIEIMKKTIEENCFEHIDAKSFDDWLFHIHSSKLLISGRFHYSIAAYCLETQFIVFNSNTRKNQGLTKLLSLDPPIDYLDYKFKDKLADQVNKILSNQKSFKKNDLKKIINLAKLNFSLI